MADVKLHISTDIQELFARVEKLEQSIKGLNNTTDDYTSRAKAGFDKVGQASDALKNDIKEQEKIIKEMSREAEKYAKKQATLTAQESAAYKRLQGDIKVANQELKGMKAQQEEVTKSAGKGNEMFKKLGAAIIGAFTVGAIINFSKQSVAAYQEQIRSEAKLRTALKGQDEAIGRLIKQGNELQRITLFNDEEIINAQGLMALYIKEEAQLKKLTPLVLDFAQAKGMDLASAANLVGKTFGSTTNALTRYGIEVNGIAGSSQRFDDIMQGLTKTVQGQAEGALTDEEKALRNASVAANEFKESWGKLVLSLTNTNVFGSLTETIDYLSWGLDKAQKSGGRFKDWWNWFWQTGDYGSEVFEMERNAEKNADQLAKNATILTQKTGGKTYGELVNDWIDAGKISDSLPKEIKSLDALKAKLDELKKEQSAAPGPEAFHSFDAEIKALEDQIALYETKKDGAAKKDKERIKSTIEENLASLDKYVEEANKKTFDINLGFGGMQSAEEFQKQIDENLKGFEFTMDLNPMVSGDEEGKAYDTMLANLADFETKMQEEWLKVQEFGDAHPLAAMLGFENEEQLEQIKDYAGQLLDFINQIVDQQVEAADRLVEEKQTQVDEQQSLVDKEFEFKKDGLANSYDLEVENLKKMQEQRDKAVKDREKMIAIQRTMATVESGISLVSAAANIIKGFSSIPIVGVVLGLAAVGAMIAGFILSTAKAKDAVKMEEGGEVGYGLLSGRRHSQGGIPINAEGGEYFTNRKSTSKYLPLLEAINKDDRDSMRVFFDRNFTSKFNDRRDKDYSKDIGNVVRELKRGKPETIYGSGFIIEKSGGYTKKIYLN
ncbi:MAG: hypothetical protein WC998_06375 [Candidatus Paceibacterota bacterium]|jgi:hypothetical protein